MNWYSPELLGFFILAPYDENILHKLPFESIVKSNQIKSNIYWKHIVHKLQQNQALKSLSLYGKSIRKWQKKGGQIK